MEDATYSIGFCTSAVEVHVAVMAACAPCLKAIASTYLPRLLGTSQRTRYPSAGHPDPTATPHSSRPGRSRFQDSAAQGGASHTSDLDHAVEMAAMEREMRKYHPYADVEGSSLSSDDGAAAHGILKTTAVSVRYTREPSPSEATGEGMTEGSVDRLV